MRKWLLFAALVLPGCIVGNSPRYDLDQDLSPDEVLRLKQLAEQAQPGEALEETVMSIPIFPLYFERRITQEATLASGNPGYEILRDQGILYYLLFGMGEKATFRTTGENDSYQEVSALLLGGIFRGWSGWRENENGLRKKPFRGFSILWGFIGVEEDNGEETVRFLWIPL